MIFSCMINQFVSLKLKFSEEATKCEKNLLKWFWHLITIRQNKVGDFFKFGAFSEYINFKKKEQIKKVNVHRVPWWFFQLNSKASPVCLTLGLCHKFLLGLTPCHLSTVFKHSFFFLLRLRLKWMAFLTPRKGERKVKIWFLNPNHM